MNCPAQHNFEPKERNKKQTFSKRKYILWNKKKETQKNTKTAESIKCFSYIYFQIKEERVGQRRYKPDWPAVQSYGF